MPFGNQIANFGLKKSALQDFNYYVNPVYKAQLTRSKQGPECTDSFPCAGRNPTLLAGDGCSEPNISLQEDKQCEYE